MASENRKIDENYKATIAGVTNDASAEIRRIRVNPTTNRMLVEQSSLSPSTDVVGIADTTDTQINPATYDVQTDGSQLTQLTDGTNVAAIDKANTARTTDTIVQSVQIVDSAGRVMKVDDTTKALNTIDYAHHEIHGGSHFFYTDKVTLANAGTQDYLITTPNTTKWAHFVFSATGSAITQIDLYESADRNGTTSQTIYNSDRNSSTITGLTIHKGTSGGTTDGTVIYTLKSGAAQAQSRSPMVAERDNEIILKQNTKYILRFTSSTDNNLTNFQAEWYEHTNA